MDGDCRRSLGIETFSKKSSDTLIPSLVQDDTLPVKISPGKGRNTNSRNRTCTWNQEEQAAMERTLERRGRNSVWMMALRPPCDGIS